MKVVKIGGNALKNIDINVLKQLQTWLAEDETVVLVHGAGPMVDEALAHVKLPVKKVAGLRYTDEATLKVMVNVVQTQVWPMLHHVLGQAHLIPTLLTEGVVARIKEAGKFGAVGEIDSITTTLMAGRLYVIGPLVSSDQGELLNVNADEIALAFARHFKADTLYFLTDVAGVLDQNQQVMSKISPTVAATLMSQEVVTGGMFIKLQAAFMAVQVGVQKIQMGRDFQVGTKLVLGDLE